MNENEIFLIVSFYGFLLLITIYDLSKGIIPNYLILSILCLKIGYMCYFNTWILISIKNIIAYIILIIILFEFFKKSLIGGGDFKAFMVIILYLIPETKICIANLHFNHSDFLQFFMFLMISLIIYDIILFTRKKPSKKIVLAPFFGISGFLMYFF